VEDEDQTLVLVERSQGATELYTGNE